MQFAQYLAVGVVIPILTIAQEIDTPAIAPSIAEMEGEPVAKMYSDYYKKFAGHPKPEFFFCAPLFVVKVQKLDARFSISWISGVDEDEIEKMNEMPRDAHLDIDSGTMKIFLELWRKWASLSDYSRTNGGRKDPFLWDGTADGQVYSFFAVATGEGHGYLEGIMLYKEGTFSSKMHQLIRDVLLVGKLHYIAQTGGELKIARDKRAELKVEANDMEEKLRERIRELIKQVDVRIEETRK